MRKGLMPMSLILVSVLVVTNPAPVNAVGAFATEITQELNNVQLVLQYARQGEQLANQIQQLADMVKNTRTLSAHNFGQLSQDIAQLAQVVQGGQALAYSLANVDAMWQQTYPGYAYNSANYYQQYQRWSQTSLDTMLGVLRAAGLQGQQLQSENSIISSLRSVLGGTQGRNEALGALSDVAEQEVEQLAKLRQLMIADMSSKQAYQATIIQHQAASEAAAERYFKYVPSISDGETFGAGWH